MRSVWNPIATISCGSLEALGAGRWNGSEVHRLTVSGGRETAGDLASHSLHLACRDQRNDAATEAAAGHPSAESSGSASHLDGKVYLRHGDLEVVPHRGMRGVKEGRQIGDAARSQHIDGLQHASVLGDHMAYPALDHRIRKLLQRGVQVGDVAQRGDSEQPRGLLTAGSAGGVFTVDQRMRCLGVQNQDF